MMNVFRKIYVLVFMCVGLSGYVVPSQEVSPSQMLLQHVKQAVQARCVQGQVEFSEPLFKKLFLVIIMALKQKKHDCDDQQKQVVTSAACSLYAEIQRISNALPTCGEFQGVSSKRYQESILAALNFSLTDIQELIVQTDTGFKFRIEDFALKFARRVACNAGVVLIEKKDAKAQAHDPADLLLLKKSRYAVWAAQVKRNVQAGCEKNGHDFSEERFKKVIVAVSAALKTRVPSFDACLAQDVELQRLAGCSIEMIYDNIQGIVKKIFDCGEFSSDQCQQCIADVERFPLEDIQGLVEIKASDGTFVMCIGEFLLKAEARGVAKARELIRIATDDLAQQKQATACTTGAMSAGGKKVKIAQGLPKTHDDNLLLSCAPDAGKNYKPVVIMKRLQNCPDWAKSIKASVRSDAKKCELIFMESVFDQIAIVVDVAYRYAGADVKKFKTHRTSAESCIFNVCNQVYTLLDQLAKKDNGMASLLNEGRLAKALTLLNDDYLQNLIKRTGQDNFEMPNPTSFIQYFKAQALEEMKAVRLLNTARLAQELEEHKKLTSQLQAEETKEKAVVSLQPKPEQSKPAAKKVALVVQNVVNSQKKQAAPQPAQAMQKVALVAVPPAIVSAEQQRAVAVVAEPGLREHEERMSRLARDRERQEKKNTRYEEVLPPADTPTGLELQRKCERYNPKMSLEQQRVAIAEKKLLSQEIDYEERDRRRQQAVRDRIAKSAKDKQEQEKIEIQEQQNKLETLITEEYVDGNLIVALQERLHVRLQREQDDALRSQAAHATAVSREQAESDKRMAHAFDSKETYRASHVIAQWVRNLDEQDRALDDLQQKKETALKLQKRLRVAGVIPSFIKYAHAEKQRLQDAARLVQQQVRLQAAQAAEPWLVVGIDEVPNRVEWEYADRVGFRMNPYGVPCFQNNQPCVLATEESRVPAGLRRKRITAASLAAADAVALAREMPHRRVMTRGGRR